MIATGSESVPLAGVEVDERQIVTSTGGLELDPGAGAAGGDRRRLYRCSSSAASGIAWAPQVTVIEFLDRLIPSMDAEIARSFERVLGKQGMKFRLGY